LASKRVDRKRLSGEKNEKHSLKNNGLVGSIEKSSRHPHLVIYDNTCGIFRNIRPA
jgi:hypothetical protein